VSQLNTNAKEAAASTVVQATKKSSYVLNV
jgi:hypothetical protein